MGFHANEESGNWHGNDSAWRMAIDLLRILLFVDEQGKLNNTPTRRIFSIIDGVIGGEKNGPLTPDSRRCGLIITGYNPCAVDSVSTRLMGFNIERIKMLTYILKNFNRYRVELSEIAVSSNVDLGDLFDAENRGKYFNFIPHPGWIGNIEIE